MLNKMLKGIKVVLVVVIVLLGWGYQAVKPPAATNECGVPITAPRIKLRDGRHIAYKEHGVPKHLAKHFIVYIHGFSSCRHDAAIATHTSQQVLEELGVYVVSFDRPGYGQSDPDPNRTVKSLALDVEELADGLGLGSKFYVVGFSMGGQAVWGSLKYIPHRLAGAALLAPVVNYWWAGLPRELSRKAYNLQLAQDQWAVGVAHYAPWLTYWWNTQKLFPPSGVIVLRAENFNSEDVRIMLKNADRQQQKNEALAQGEFETLHRDMMVGFGNWEFSPLDLHNPFPEGGGSVHVWQGDDDRLSPVILQRYIAEKLPWIQYHELAGSGHMFPLGDGMAETVLRALLFDQKL